MSNFFKFCGRMAGKTTLSQCRSILLVFTLLASFDLGQAQISTNITSFGAVGDAVQFYVNTVSNSVVVTTANQLSSADIGKTIEVYVAGAPTYGLDSFGNTNGHEDLIATIINVVNGTNIYMSLPASNTLVNAFATYGTDNTPNFMNAIAACGAYTNVTFNIPAGEYLCMPILGNGYALGSIALHRGGLHFLGDNQTNTILLGRGAWQVLHFSSGVVYPFRGFLIEVVAPITNDYPLIFENLTLDGGVQQGNTPVHGINVNPVDGLGWDQQHSAYLACDSANNNCATATHQVFTNVTVAHWRGEMIKSIDQNTNGNISIYNCSFLDGDASALNCFQSWDVEYNTFSNVFLLAEYGQDYHTNTSYFCNNFTTNVTGNAFAFDVLSSWHVPPFIMESNNFWFNAYACNGIMTSPGANIYILNNQFHCADYTSVFDIGGVGSQGTLCNSNIVISGNSIYADANNALFAGNAHKLNWIFTFGAGGIQAVHSLTICSNTISAAADNALIYAACSSDNVRFYNNNCGTNTQSITIYTVGGGMLPLIETNNSYVAPRTFLDHPTTNTLSYGNGPLVYLDYVCSSNVFILQDTNCWQQIPANAYINIDNRYNRWAYQNGGVGGDVIVYPSQAKSTPMLVPSGTQVTFYWTGTAWTTNTAPIIQLAVNSYSFGSILSGASRTNVFTLQNVGLGALLGTVSVSAPFSILSGGSYNLGLNQSQTVTVVFNPTTPGTYNQTLSFLGGLGANINLSGTATALPQPPSNLRVVSP